MSATPDNSFFDAGHLSSDPTCIHNEHQEAVNIKLEPEERSSNDTACFFSSDVVDREVKTETDCDAAGNQIELSTFCPFCFKYTQSLPWGSKGDSADIQCTCTRTAETELSCSLQSTSCLDLSKTTFNPDSFSAVSLDTNCNIAQKRPVMSSECELSNQGSYDRHCFAVIGNLSGMTNGNDMSSTVSGLDLYSLNTTYVNLPSCELEIKTESIPVLDPENNISAVMLIQNQEQVHFQKRKNRQRYRSIHTSKDFEKNQNRNGLKSKQSFSAKYKSNHAADSRSRNGNNSAVCLYARSLAGQDQYLRTSTSLILDVDKGRKKLKKRSGRKDQERKKTQKGRLRNCVRVQKGRRTILEAQVMLSIKFILFLVFAPYEPLKMHNLSVEMILNLTLF